MDDLAFWAVVLSVVGFILIILCEVYLSDLRRKNIIGKGSLGKSLYAPSGDVNVDAVSDDVKIDTQRLEIVPLRYSQLHNLIYDREQLCSELDCKYEGTPIEGEFKAITESQLRVLEHEKENFLWCSFWLIIRKSDRVALGSIDFKDVPNKDGEAEIGYGLGESHKGNGYMSETVRALCEWALSKDEVSRIVAETKPDNIASQRVLQKCGFKEYSKDKTIWWKLE